MAQWSLSETPNIQLRKCPGCQRWLVPWKFAKNQSRCKACKRAYYLAAKERINER